MLRMLDLTLQPATQLAVIPDHRFGCMQNPHERGVHVVRVECSHDDGELAEDIVLDIKVTHILRRADDKHVWSSTMVAEFLGERFQSGGFSCMRGELRRNRFWVRDKTGL